MQINLKPEIPSFGLAYIAATLKNNGYFVELLDIDACRYPKDHVLETIKSSDADIIGIGGLVTVYPYLSWLVPTIRSLKPKTEIILGGTIASSLKQRCFERFEIDYEVIGEGENTIIELLKQITSDRDFSSVKGIGYRDKEGKIVFTEKRPLMESLEGLPIFDDTLFPITTLLKNSGGAFQVHAQRGCPANCTFCFNNFRVVSSRVRYRPYKKLVDEIELFANKYGKEIKLFVISGECLTLNKEWIIAFCKEIIDRGLKIKYRVSSRVDTIDEERLEWLKRSGCSVISFGLESGSNKILRIIKKGTTVELNKKAVLLAKKYIKEVEACVILGYLDEDEATLQETVRFCKEIDVKPSIFFATAFPGTELYISAVKRGIIKDEESYIMGLDKVLTFRPSLNLTKLSEERAKKAIKTALREITLFYFFKEPMRATNVFKRAFRHAKENGLKSSFCKVIENINRYV